MTLKSSLLNILIATLCLGLGSFSSASETDQFTPPPAPLVDIGPLISKVFYDTLKKIQSKSNDKTTAEDISVSFLKAWGKGLPYTHLEKWFYFSKTVPKNGIFKVSQKASIYKGLVGFPLPASLVILAPTVNMYGDYFGIDKLGHFIQQGKGVFDVYQKNLMEGLSAAEAQTKAVDYNVNQEQTYFGTLLDGVYSNGDLAADFAGLKFYQNLFNPVKIGDDLLQPIFIREGSHWKINPVISPGEMLRPFITPHLSEMLNPSIYLFFGESVRKEVQLREAALEKAKAYYPLTTTEDLTLWKGEAYGHGRGRGVTFSLATECPNLFTTH